jgi:hypothetical protein
MRITSAARLPEKVWEADVLPLNYARAGFSIAKLASERQGQGSKLSAPGYAR